MTGKKQEGDYLALITESVARVLANKQVKVSMDMLFKKDLGLNSLDVVDVGYELEQQTGLKVRLNEVFLTREDVYIRDIAKYLAQLSEKK